MSVEEKIEEALVSFMVYLSSVLDPSIVGEKIRQIETKFQALKEQILGYVSSIPGYSPETQKTIDFLREEVSKLQKEKTELEAQVDSLKQKVEELTNEREELRKEVEDLKKDNTGLRQEVEELKARIGELSEENESLKYEFELAVRARDETEERLEKLKKELEEVRRKKEDLEISLQSLDADLRWASNRLRDEIVSDVSSLREQIRNLMYELRTLVPPRIRPKIERIGMLVNQMHTRIRAKDFGAALVRLLSERRKIKKK